MNKLTDEMIQGAIDRNPEYQVVPKTNINPATCKADLLGICAVDAGFLKDHDLANYYPTADRMGEYLGLDANYSLGVALGFDNIISVYIAARPYWTDSPACREGLAVGQKWREKLGYPVARDYSAEATP